jgi:hypothetical protein
MSSTSTLPPTESRISGFARLYVFDSNTETQVNMRCSIMDGLDRKIVATIQRVINKFKSFVEMLLRGGKFIGNQEVLNFRLAIHEAPGVDWRTNNSLTCNEVAATLLYDNMGVVRNFILHLRCGGLQRINDTHPTCVPLHFPLLFSHELVWHLAVRYKGDATNHKNNRVPCREFAAYRLYVTVSAYPLLDRAPRLFLREVSTLSKCECLACPGRQEPADWLLYYY